MIWTSLLKEKLGDKLTYHGMKKVLAVHCEDEGKIKQDIFENLHSSMAGSARSSEAHNFHYHNFKTTGSNQEALHAMP